MMDYRENAGYVITDSCHVGESEFVLGVHLLPGNAKTGRITTGATISAACLTRKRIW